MRLHKKVWLWWGSGWALQYYRAPCASFGVHLDPRRPLLDGHGTPLTPLVLAGWLLGFWSAWWLLASLLPVGVLTVSLGHTPVVTNELDRHRHTCRGFLFLDSPLL